MSTDSEKSGPLAGVKIIELAGIGPAPLCCTLLADMGADILRIDRNAPSGLGSPRTPKTDLLRRSRPSVSIDMKHPKGIAALQALIDQADAIIDPFRPGVTERLGVGPEDCMARNPKLVYGRMTGWGQDGTLSQAAGHDLNYLALTGVLHAIGPKEIPVPPLNVVADMGGGAMFLAVGILAGVIEARQSGKGQVVDIAMTEGSAFLGTGAFGTLAREIADKGVTVNHILPGPFDTALLRRVARDIVQRPDLSEEEAVQEYAKHGPMKRLGTVEEFGSLCAYLCSRKAGYITAQGVAMDGGLVTALY